MKVSYRDQLGHEIDRVVAPGDGSGAVVMQALDMMARHAPFHPGDAVFFADDAPSRLPTEPVIITANEAEALAARLTHRALLIDGDDPEGAADARLAARLCRHAVDAGWIFRSVVL